MVNFESSNDFFQEKILIKNPEILAEKINKMKELGREKLAVLTDFDRTLTKSHSQGRPVNFLIAVLRDEKYLTADYSVKAQALFEKYHPFENDHSLSLEERSAKMEAWWREHFALLLASDLKKEDVEKATNHQKMEPRKGLEDFLKKLSEQGIPLSIVSAGGLGEEAISLFLEKRNWFFDNIKIISNAFIWNESGQAVGVREPIVHSCNKNGSMLESFSQLKGKENFLVLGDGIDDLQMAEGLKINQLISVLFFNKKENNIEEYQSKADIVISGDGSMAEVNKILEQILES